MVGLVGLAENKANSAPIELELELRLSLAKMGIIGILWKIRKLGNAGKI